MKLLRARDWCGRGWRGGEWTPVVVVEVGVRSRLRPMLEGSVDACEACRGHILKSFECESHRPTIELIGLSTDAI